MAGAATALLQSENPASYGTTISIEAQWDVEYSRFFNYPRFLSSHSPSLKPLPKCKTRSTGTWISSSSMASVHLLSPSAILAVSIRGKIHEEHFVSNLHFSWPQVSCATNCPTRGSRVVLTSFRDSHSQESVKDMFDIEFPRRGFGCESSSQSEYIASNAIHPRTDEESSFVKPDVSYHTEMPVSRVDSEQLECSQQPLLDNNFGTVFSALPPSFTELLTGCLTEHKNNEPPKVPEEIDMMSQVTRCISDSSFHDFMTRVDMVIDELGGDMTI
ncbi:protein POOR HOMOLOGOUS SYNAPSIS 1-like isoform X2 [Magnolia sinica]|uniref:protein POOR HOMOLOGOUS SYNAPSIS 1-like isoform X2 n=1 Tax=Magnolia sinica TaxID=86752 RepID=UPI002658273C|nr:protein POOR HOMOLOGOUS SYNAPSIS 1-like isoform X2 [Magnolia sinica]